MTPEQERAFLELVPTARLYDEFKRRFAHVVIAGLMPRPTPEDPDHHLLSYAYVGMPLVCQGLALQLIRRCQGDMDETMWELDIHEL